MVETDVPSYLKKLKRSFARKNGREVAQALDLGIKEGSNSKLPMSLIGESLKRASPAQLGNQCSKFLGSAEPSPKAAEVVAACLLCAREYHCGNLAEAYDQLVAGVQPFLDLFRQEEETWVVEPLHVMVSNLRHCAELADSAIKAAGDERVKPDKLENAGNHLMSCFSAANRPQGDPDKRLATLRIVNSLFRIYFKLNTLRNCKYLIRVVDAKKFVAFPHFQAGDRVTYKFFVGRLAVFDENFDEANDHLSYAFDHCHPSHYTQRRLILKYLVPVKIFAKQSLPSDALLQKYDLAGWYSAIKEAVKTGSVGKFEEALREKMALFVQAGIFLLMEKLRVAVYRRLLKRVKLIHAEMRPEKAVQVPLRYFVGALQWQGYVTDLDEVECIVANLIYNGHVKGYISHKSGVVVLSKKEPFPAMKIY